MILTYGFFPVSTVSVLKRAADEYVFRKIHVSLNGLTRLQNDGQLK
jgi:hypothetical protein